jgi:ribosomal protein S18 acetylase RimI-like enzyme
MPCTDQVGGAIAVAEHSGPRADLRALFELAEDSSAQLDAYLDSGRVLVAIDGDEIIGHIQVTETQRPVEAEIKNMAVGPSHQGRGVGRALIAAAITLARGEGRSTLVVATAAADTGNLRFYQRLGFRIRSIDRDAFTAATGYEPGLRVDGIELRDRVWLDLPVDRPDRTLPGARLLVTSLADRDLYARGTATLLASWEEIARGSSGASLLRLDGVAAAVFPDEPERGVYNNALLTRDLGATERARAVDAMHAAYSAAGIDRYAAWVHESDEGMRGELSARGFTVAESTRAMGMPLDDIAVARRDVGIRRSDWLAYLEYLRVLALPVGLLSGVDPNAFHVLAAGGRDGETAATAIAFDHDGDCGVFNVSTLEPARRSGLGTALTARLVHDAATRGCSTASLQSTEMAERVYASVGFRDLGRILEYAP